MPKQEAKTASIEITCTASQKAAIKAQSGVAGARSVSEYLLTLAFEGDAENYRRMRRKAEGPLINAATYQRLGELVALLSERLPDNEEMQDLIEFIHATRREIALKRLLNDAGRL